VIPYYASNRTFTPRLQAAPTSRTTTTSTPSAVSWEGGPPEPRLMRELLLAAPARGVVLRVCVRDSRLHKYSRILYVIDEHVAKLG
jgi:hypothetical protein